MSVKKETAKEAVQTYEGLPGSRQTFHAIGSFEAINGTVVMRSPDYMKEINPRKYRDQIFLVKEAVDRYMAIGEQLIMMKRFGVYGMDELQDILDDFGAKILEAIAQLSSMNMPIPAKAADFAERYKLYTAAMKAEVML